MSLSESKGGIFRFGIPLDGSDNFKRLNGIKLFPSLI